MTISRYRKLIFITILLFALGVIAILFANTTDIISYDYWWHVKTGEWIIQNNKVPTNDIFSWYGMENNLSWISHEWLSALVLYGITKIFGIHLGGWFFVLLTMILLLSLLIVCNKRKYQNNFVFSIVWILIGGCILELYINPRPYLISYILLASTIYICESLRKNEKSKCIYFLPIISMLWANFHGGSSNLVYIIPLCYLVPNLFSIKWYRLQTNKINAKQIKKYTICIILSVITLTINPHGINMLMYPYINMLDSAMQQYITEWRAIDMKVDLFLGLFIFFIIFIGMFTKKDLRITDCIILFFFMFLSFRSVRFVPMLYIVASFYVFYYIKPFNVKENNVFYYYIRYLPIVTLLFGCAAIGVGIYTYCNNNEQIQVKKLISDEVIEEIQKNNYKKIYNSYGLGGYLIYNDINPFIDGRADMYSRNIFRPAMKIEYLDANIKEEFDKYEFDAFVIMKDSVLGNYMKSVDNYKLIIEDENEVLYER